MCELKNPSPPVPCPLKSFFWERLTTRLLNQHSSLMGPTIHRTIVTFWMADVCISHVLSSSLQWLLGRSLQFCCELLLYGPVTYLFSMHGVSREMGSWILFTQIFSVTSLVVKLYLAYSHHSNQTSLSNFNQQYQAHIL